MTTEITREEMDYKIFKDIMKNFDHSDIKQLELIKFLLVDSVFLYKERLVRLLIDKSKQTGYSILRKLLWLNV